MLLGDSHIEKPLWKVLGEFIQPGAFRHGRSDGNDFVILAANSIRALPKTRL